MERVRLMEHRGHSIVFLDFTNIKNPAEGPVVIAAAKEFFARQPPTQQLRTLTDVTGSHYDARTLEALKDLAAHNRPYVGVAAAVVNTALHRVAMNLAAMFARRKFTAFATREQALDWLVAQELPSAKEGAAA
jgi:hypothetical protein